MVGGGDPFYVKFWVNRPPLERNRLACVRQLGHYAGLITTTTSTLFTFYSIDLKFVKSKNAVNADRMMKFIDENELNYI